MCIMEAFVTSATLTFTNMFNYACFMYHSFLSNNKALWPIYTILDFLL